jgi:hypothetical protein
MTALSQTVNGPYFFYDFVCEAIGTAATPGLLRQPRVSENDCGEADGM